MYQVSLSFGLVGATKFHNFPTIFGLDFIQHTNWTFWIDINSNLPLRTVAIDLRGFGLSDRPRGISNYKLSNMVEDLRAFLEHLGM